MDTEGRQHDRKEREGMGSDVEDDLYRQVSRLADEMREELNADEEQEFWIQRMERAAYRAIYRDDPY